MSGDAPLLPHEPLPENHRAGLPRPKFVLPVQAKGGSDQLSVVQSEQDLLWCRERLPNLICRPILTQFAEGDLIAMFEVTLEDDEIKLVQEKHYRLVPASEVTQEDLLRYRNST